MFVSHGALGGAKWKGRVLNYPVDADRVRTKMIWSGDIGRMEGI